MANRVFPANSLNLDGIPLTSTGVRPIQSPKLILNNRPPTPADANKAYPMGTIWVVINRAAAAPDQYEFWYLADNQSIPGALWLRFAVSPSGEFAAIFPTDNGTAFPIGTVLNIFGSNGGAPNHTGDNINTFVGSTTNTVVVALNHSLHMPASSADGTQGVWFTRASGSPLEGGNIFISNLGIANTFVGELSGNLTLNAGVAENNSGFGAGSLAGLTTGTNNSAGGYVSGASITTGSANTIYGSQSGQNITTASDNCLFGYKAGALLTTAGDSIAIGSGALQSETNGGGAVAIGFNALANTTASGASEAVAIGYQSQSTATKISSNTSVGYRTLNAMNGDGSTTAYQNAVLGAMGLVSLTTGSMNTAVGNGVAQNLTTGVNNCFFGSIVDPAANQVGGAYTSSESNNILIMSIGVIGDSNTIRIGTATGTGTGQYNKTFISGIRGITTTAADAIAVLISSTGQLGTASSSIRFKENVRNMNDDSSFIYDLRPVTFNYKDRTVAERSPGLIAEEVETVAPWLVARDMDGEIESVRYHELSVLLLNELKKLNHRVALLEDQLNDCSC